MLLPLSYEIHSKSPASDFSVFLNNDGLLYDLILSVMVVLMMMMINFSKIYEKYSCNRGQKMIVTYLDDSCL